MIPAAVPTWCRLRLALAEYELCPHEACAFWEEGGAALEPGCAIERLAIPIEGNRDLARHLLDLRLTLEATRSPADRAAMYRRFIAALGPDRG